MSTTQRSAHRGPIYLVVSAIMVMLVLGVFIGTRSDENESGSASLDDRATAVREQLGDLCPSFDFQLKEEVGGGTVRPIHCQENGIEETHLRVFVFTDGDALDAWRSDLLLKASSHPERQEKVEFGEDWAITSIDAKALELAAERLGEG